MNTDTFIEVMTNMQCWVIFSRNDSNYAKRIRVQWLVDGAPEKEQLHTYQVELSPELLGRSNVPNMYGHALEQIIEVVERQQLNARIQYGSNNTRN